jgi:hypothetical protein
MTTFRLIFIVYFSKDLAWALKILYVFLVGERECGIKANVKKIHKLITQFADKGHWSDFPLTSSFGNIF